MTDKEVGELWQKYFPWSGLHGMELQAAKDICALIRKLVEERKRWILRDWANTTWAVDEAGAESVALEDFGISEDSWQEKS